VLRLLGLALVLVALICVAPAAASAAGTFYAVGKRLCKPPKIGHMACLAVRRVVVKKGTPGGRAFQAGAGAVQSAAGPAALTIGPNGGITPYDLATAYGYNSLTNASSQTVAIVDAYDDPTIESDLQAFDSEYGLTTCTTANGCFKKVNQTGATSPLPAVNSGWVGEIALDVETVHSVCQTCHVLLVEANSSGDVDVEAAVNEAAKLKATEISNSYGDQKAPGSADLAAYNHPGIVITAGAGDDGYYGFDLWLVGTNGNLPFFPASAATVVAVGGTSLFLDQYGARQSESVWNDDGIKDYWEQSFLQPLGATGGGCSTSIPAPAWQTGLSVWGSTGCGSYRLDADVSSDADYLTGFDTYDTTGGSGWSTVGGTSLSAPTIAAMFALAGGAHGVSYPALSLYGHLGHSPLYDVTVGGNGYCGGAGASQCGDVNDLGFGPLDCDYTADGTAVNVGDRACDALPGYDGPTGEQNGQA
jgi:subtilase family serine protease